MGADRRVAGWVLVVVGAGLTILSFVERPPLDETFPKVQLEGVARPMPVAANFVFVKAPYPFDHRPWPYERLPGGALQLREAAK